MQPTFDMLCLKCSCHHRNDQLSASWQDKSRGIHKLQMYVQKHHSDDMSDNEGLSITDFYKLYAKDRYKLYVFLHHCVHKNIIFKN